MNEHCTTSVINVEGEPSVRVDLVQRGTERETDIVREPSSQVRIATLWQAASLAERLAAVVTIGIGILTLLSAIFTLIYYILLASSGKLDKI